MILSLTRNYDNLSIEICNDFFVKYHVTCSKFFCRYIFTVFNPQAVGILNLNYATLILKNWPVSGFFTNIFYNLNLTEEHKSKLSQCSLKIRNYDFCKNHIISKFLILKLIVISKITCHKIETIGVSDQYSNMLFLRNEFSKIFEYLFTMT